MNSPEEKDFSKRIFVANTIRITTLFVFLFLVLILFLFKLPFMPVPILIFILVSIILSFTNSRFYATKKSLRLYVNLQILLDIAIITGVVYFTGGYSSPFYFLYFFPIAISAMTQRKIFTYYTAAQSYIFYGVLSDLMYLRVVDPFPGLLYGELSKENLIYNLITGFIAFLFFAYISTLYFEKIRKKDKELKSIQENLDDLMVLNNLVLERMGSGFLISQESGRIISLNEKARKQLKINENSNIFRLLKIKNSSELLRLIGESGDTYSMEIKRSGFVLDISISFLENIYSFNKIYIFLIADLTKRRKIEDSLKKREHLALIGEMSAGIAHELRNPLASISGSIQFIKNELELKEDMKNLMDIVVKESKRLSDSIEEFLQFTRTPPLEEDKFDLYTSLEEVSEMIIKKNPGIDIRKRYNKNIVLKGDERRIRQVLFNIINNSVKAVSEKGMIEISVYSKNSKTYLSVKDNGIGMSKKDMDKIFIPFYTKFTSGIGLGMSLVKRILDEQGFSIEINSKSGVGTEVIICLNKN